MNSFTAAETLRAYTGGMWERTELRRGRRRVLQGSLALAGLGLLAGCGLGPPQLQPKPKIPRIGWLVYGNPPRGAALEEIVFRGLQRLGYTEGQNIAIDYHFGEGRPERLPALAAELVSLNPDLIIAIGTDVALVVREATRTIPIVMGSSADPVAVGLASSLARPGGNVTGVSLLVIQLGAKRLEVLTDVVPGLSQVAVLWNPAHVDRGFQELEEAGHARGLQLQSLEVSSAGELDRAFTAMASARPEALIVVPSRLMTFFLGRIIDFTAQHRLPMVSAWRDFADAGGLLTYGPDRFEVMEQCATYVDRILKGGQPGDLPIVQPTKFDFVINLKTAQALGLTIPHSVLQQATEVLQ